MLQLSKICIDQKLSLITVFIMVHTYPTRIIIYDTYWPGTSADSAHVIRITHTAGYGMNKSCSIIYKQRKMVIISMLL